MKKQFIISYTVVTIVLFTLSSCLNFSKETVRGNGEITSRSQELSPFQSVSVFGSFKTTYVVDPQYKVSIVAESNLMEYILVDVEEGILTIKVDENISFNTKEEINILIQGPAPGSISQAGSGDMVIGTITHDAAINITLAGSGSISGQIHVPRASMNLAGSGSINISGVVGGLLTEVTGSGIIDAGGLTSSNTDATVNGSGSIHAGSSDKLTARVTGSGQVYYLGDPEIESSITGSGAVIPDQK